MLQYYEYHFLGNIMERGGFYQFYCSVKYERKAKMSVKILKPASIYHLILQWNMQISVIKPTLGYTIKTKRMCGLHRALQLNLYDVPLSISGSPQNRNIFLNKSIVKFLHVQFPPSPATHPNSWSIK